MERDRFFGDTSLVLLAVFGLIATGLAQSHAQDAAGLMLYIVALLGFAPLIGVRCYACAPSSVFSAALMERISAAYHKAGQTERRLQHAA